MSIKRMSSFLAFGAVALISVSAANAHTLDGLVIDRNDLEFSAASGEMRYFHCSAVIMSNGATEGLGAGGSTGGAGLLSTVNTIGSKLVARFNFNGVFTSRQDFGGNHRIRVTFGNAALDFVGTVGSSTGFLYGTAVLTADNANPEFEDPASVPVGTIVEARFGVTLLNGATFGAGMFSNNFNFAVDGVVDCSRPKRAGFDADCNGNLIIDAIDIAETLESDCNDNGAADSCDLLAGVSLDCDENAVPDECDPDCNANGLPDACDISGAASQDCNSNAVPDECEPDCNESGVPDDCDIEKGASLDCNQNLLPDECDVAFARFNLAGTLASLQANHDTLSSLIPDRYDFVEGGTGSRIVNGGNNMYNGGNILNTNLATEIQYSNNQISPNMGAFGSGSQYFTAKYNGLFVLVASNIDISYFRITGNIPTNFLGVSDTLKLSVNDRGKYYDVFVRRIWAAYRPSINHLIIVPAGPDDVIQTVSPQTNNEQHEVQPLGNVNEIYYLLTSRSDGTPLSAESATQLAIAFLQLRQVDAIDCNENGIPDECDLASPEISDCNGNQIPDDCESQADCNANGVQDICESLADCDNDGISDACEIGNCPPGDLTCLDCDENGIPDGCEIFEGEYSLNFDGQDDYVRVPRHASLEPAQALTIEAWIKPDGAGGFHNRIARITADFASGYILAGSQGGDQRLQLRIDSASGGSTNAKDTVALSTYTGQWVHVAGVYSSTQNYCRLYVNGILKGSAASAGTILYSNSALYIGNYIAASNEDFDGQIAEVRIWNVARTEAELTATMNKQLLGHEPGLVGYWQFDEGAGQTTYDRTPFENHGQLGSQAAADSNDPAWASSGPPLQVDDCNNNDIPDSCDIDSNMSGDCNENNVPDECEFGGNIDCDNDGTPEMCEPGGMLDCDEDGIPNACEIANCAPGDLTCIDCDEDGIPDGCFLVGPNHALRFNGVNSLVKLPDNLIKNHASLTVEAWFRTSSPGILLGYQQSIYPNTPSGGEIPAVYVGTDGLLRGQFWNGAVNPITSAVAVNDGNWHHVALSSNGNQQHLYLDGTQVNSTPLTGTINHLSMNGNQIGMGWGSGWPGAGGTGWKPFNGDIDEVRMWDYARSTQQILDHMTHSFASPPPGLFGYWRFDDFAGQFAMDASPQGNNGTLGTTTDPDSNDPSWLELGAPFDQDDCNNNGRLDHCDVSRAGSADCNDNLIPDECESQADCNQNGWIDICEEGGSADCNADGTTDWCELDAGASDCDGDATPDNCETAAGNAALVFDGINDLLVLPDDLIRSRTTLTLEAWFKTTAGGVIFGYQNAAYPTSPGNYTPALYVGTDGKLRGQFYNNVSAPITTAGTVSDGQWHHVALVGAVNAQSLYLDGVLINSTPLAGTITHSNMSRNQVGTGRAGNTWPASPSTYYAFNGTIDEVRLWDVARTGPQIAANRFKSFASPQPGLAGYWKLNAGSGQAALDSSGFGRHGTRGITTATEVNDPNWISPSYGSPSPSDCNGNTIPDSCDFSSGTSTDCNENNTPDECESDCNNNGVADECDIANATAPDCNANSVPDSCDIASGFSIDANANSIPDSCEPDIRIVPVVTLVDPAVTTEIRSAEPVSQEAVTRGGYYYVEIWASDLGSTNTGLTGVYVDVNFCAQSVAEEVQHGSLFTLFPSGTIQTGKVDEFGGSALPGGQGVSPQWVRIGWIKMLATIDVSSCAISLTQGAGGVAALGRGLIPDSLVSRSSTTIEIAPPLKSYDLDDSTVINVGDLSLFAASWQETVPPGDEDHDFDCNDFVGVSDLSWFATGWNKSVTDPTILYPPCVDSGGGRGAPADIDAKFRVTVRAAASGSDTVLTLPASLTSITAGQQFHVEIWASDVGDVNTGLTSAYVDLTFPPEASVVSMNHHSVFNVFGSGQTSGQLVDELGGSTLSADTAAEPLWVRVASVRMLATEDRPVFQFGLTPSATGIASYGRGELPWSSVELLGLSIGTPQPGDIDGDGDIDNLDITLFTNVLLGHETDASRIDRADLNADDTADGADVQGFVEAMVE